MEETYIYAVQNEDNGLFYQPHRGYPQWVPLGMAKFMTERSADAVATCLPIERSWVGERNLRCKTVRYRLDQDSVR